MSKQVRMLCKACGKTTTWVRLKEDFEAYETWECASCSIQVRLMNVESVSFPLKEGDKNFIPDNGKARFWEEEDVPIGALIRANSEGTPYIILTATCKVKNCMLVSPPDYTLTSEFARVLVAHTWSRETDSEWCWPHEQFEDKWRPCKKEPV